MITIYAGRIQTNQQTNEEYVANFYTFYIPHITSKTNKWEQGTGSGIYSESEFTLDYGNMANSQCDHQGTNIIEVYRAMYGLSDSDNDLSPLVGTKMNFFSSNNISDKLPFECWVADVNNSSKGVELRFGIKQNSIFMRILVRNMTKQSFGFQQYWLCSNDLYSGDTIDNLLSTSKSYEQTLFTNGTHLKTFNVPPYAPLAFYYTTHDYLNEVVTMGGMNYETGYTTPSGMGVQGSNMENLSRWSNWYRMLKGYPFYGNPYTFDIPEQYQEESDGLTKIEFGIMTSQRRLDDGGDDMVGTFSNSSSEMSMYNGEHTGKAYSYFCTGTNICEMFDLSNNSIQQRYFAGGYIERKIVGSFRVQYAIKNSNGTLACFCGDRDTIERMSKPASWNGEGRKYNGIYLFVNNDFTSIPGSGWIREIPDNISHWTATDCPLFFATLTVNNWMPFSYIDRTTMNWTDRDCVGMVTNVTNNSKDFYWLMDQTSSMTKQFWVDLLEGFGDEEDINIGGGSIGGGTSTSGGGHGAFNDSSASITGIGDLLNTNQPSLVGNGASPALINAYKIDRLAMFEFIEKCWDTSWDITDITKSFGNSVEPMSAIIACKFCPFTVPAGSSTNGIQIGGKTMLLENNSVYGISSEIVHLTFGSIDLEEYFGSFVDYDETKISIALPFVGINEINTRECMGGTITLDGYVDIMDGSITYFLTLVKNNVTNLVNIWRGVACWDMPLSGRDMHDKNAAMIQSITSTVGGAATGAVNGFLLTGTGAGAAAGAGIAAATGLASGVSNYLSSRPSLVRGSNFAGDRNSISKAFLIIERPKLSLPEDYAHEYGYPSNITTKMGYLTGFTVVAETHLTNMGGATQEEIREIETLLKSGVVF